MTLATSQPTNPWPGPTLSITGIMSRAVLIALLVRAAAADQALLAVPKVVDLGELRQDQTAVAILPIRNLSDGSLVVEAIRGSCGCTTIEEVHDMRLAPGDEVRVRVSVDTSGKIGKLNESVILVIRGSDVPEVVTIKGHIRNEYPRVVDFGYLQPSSLPRKEVMIVGDPNEPPVEILSMQYNEASLHVRNVPRAGSNVAALIVEVVSDANIVDERLILHTNDKVVPIKRIQVLARRVQALQVSESVVIFSDVVPGKSVSRKINVLCREPKTISALDAVHIGGDENFTAKVEPSSLGGKVLLLTFSAPSAAKKYYTAKFILVASLSDNSTQKTTVEAYARVLLGSRGSEAGELAHRIGNVGSPTTEAE